MKLTCATYNVHKIDDQWPWTNTRRDAVVEQIVEAAPDVIGLNEVTHKKTAPVSMRDTLMVALPARYHRTFPVGIEPEGSTHLNEIVYNNDTIAPLEGADHSGVWELRPLDNRGQPVFASWQRFEDRRTGERFVFAVCHLSVDGYADDATRADQADYLLRQLAAVKNGQPVIVVGDFNSHHGHTLDGPRVAMEEANMADAFDVAPLRDNLQYASGNGGTNPPKQNAGRVGYHLDHIYVGKGVSCQRWTQQVRLDADGRYSEPFASNHNLIRAVLTM